MLQIHPIKMLGFFLFGLFAACSAAVIPQTPLQLPSYVETCQRNSPDVNECILGALRNLVPYLVKGIKELGLPAIDPYYIDEQLTGYTNGHIQGKSIVKDVYTRGLANIQFLAVRTNFEDLDNFKIDIDILLPTVRSEGIYKLQGKFLGTDFGGKGDFKVDMTNVTATWALSGSQQIVDGVRYMRIKHFEMEPEVGDMKVHAANLFSGNEALSKSILKIFNQYWRVVYRELLPFAKEGWDKEMRGVANKVFQRVPFDEIFPLAA